MTVLFSLHAVPGPENGFDNATALTQSLSALATTNTRLHASIVICRSEPSPLQASERTSTLKLSPGASPNGFMAPSNNQAVKMLLNVSILALPKLHIFTDYYQIHDYESQ